MQPYRIIVADDHILFRQGVSHMLAASPACEVVAEAGDGPAVIARVQQHLPDIVLLDISMPGMGGMEVIREIKARNPGVRLLVLTMHNNVEYMAEALEAGADGYILKQDAYNDLITAIDTVCRGQSYLSPLIAGQMTRDFIKRLKGRTDKPAGTLTRRQREVLALVADGKTSRQIADTLCISVRTVENHRAAIMEKIGARTTADLVRFAIGKGYIKG